MGKIYNYDTHSFIGGVAKEVAKQHKVKEGVKPSEHRPHAERKDSKKAPKAKGC